MQYVKSSRLINFLIFSGILLGYIALFSNFHQIVASVQQIAVERLVIVIGLSLINYWIRIIRFNFFTRRVAIHPINKDVNALIFLSGLSMNVTPGRIGEVIKAYLQRRFFGESFARMAPIVFIERLTDALAMLSMMSLGVLAFKRGLILFIVFVMTVFSMIVILHQRGLAEYMISLLEKFSIAKKAAKKASRSFRRVLDASYRLTNFFSIVVGALLGIVAWSTQAVGLWVLLGSTGQPLSLSNLYLSLFIFAAAAAAGFVVLVPAGLGVTELSMIGLLQQLASISASDAVAITFAFRLATLWLGTFFGLTSMAYLERRMRS